MLIHLEKLGKSFGEKVVLHDVSASVDFLDPKDTDSDKRLQRRANKFANLAISRRIQALTVVGVGHGVQHLDGCVAVGARAGGAAWTGASCCPTMPTGPACSAPSRPPAPSG